MQLTTTMVKKVGISMAGVLLVLGLGGCSSNKKTESTAEANKENSTQTLEQITKKAKAEGQVASVGMPDSWANWVGTWGDIKTKYGINHTDTDMSSAEELAKFQSEGTNGTADIGDVGISFGPLAVQKNLVQAYKTSYWKDIPSWAKDDKGYWMLSYTGTISFMVDTKNVKNIPKTWKELANSKYKVAIGDVTKGNQSQFAVLAAAIANGGDETNIAPGLKYFAKIAKEGRLSSVDSTMANLEKGEIDVAVMWDFNALNYRDQVDKTRFKVEIPTDGSVMSGYTTLINKNAPHPNAAKLAREYILSDEGQINLAKGYARPIRSTVKLPQEVKDKLLPDSEYKSVQPLKDSTAWDKTALSLPEKWQQEVLIYAK